MPLKGRLGLESARVPQTDRHGLMWLERGKLAVESGNVVFTTAGSDFLEAGAYDIPFQQVSNLLLGPGTTISHDAMRLLARHQTGMVAVGSGGVRIYAVSMPFGPDRSKLGRRQARVWADDALHTLVARRMYAMRFDEVPPQRDLDALRGIEGRRIKESYERLSDQYGIAWKGRDYDREHPEHNDVINQAINHAATAMYAAGRIAVAVTGAIPELGFVHESSGHAFALDIADLYRTSITLPIAFKATRRYEDHGRSDIEPVTRKLAGETIRKDDVVPDMIDDIQEVLDVDDDCDDA